jgi:hypothetical protein
LKAPRLIARSSVAPVRWVTLERELGEIDRDLTTTPNPFGHPDADVPVTLQRSRVQPPAVDSSTVWSAPAPAGV